MKNGLLLRKSAVSGLMKMTGSSGSRFEFLDVFRVISADTNDFHKGKGNKEGES